MSAFRPCGLVTLLTDFGLGDPYVGVMKGVLHARAPSLRAVVDLTHGVPPQDLLVAAFFLRHSWAWFPAGTVHVCVVDPGVGSGRAIVAATVGEHAFLVPDNGLIGPLLEAARAAGTEASLRRVDAEGLGLGGGSRTFHGRDRFAPLAALLVEGTSPEALGPAAREGAGGAARIALGPARREGPDRFAARVLFADRFGNLVTDLRDEDLAPDPRAWTVVLEGRRVPVVGTYADVAPGALLALVDSYGHLELAVREGSAGAETGLRRGTLLRVERGAPTDAAADPGTGAQPT